MARKLAAIAMAAALAPLLLAGCSLQMPAIIGSIFVGTSSGPVWGGTEFHVLLYEQVAFGVEVIDPADPATVNGLTAISRLNGTFPGSPSDSYLTVTYTIADVPAGEYFLFVWIDGNGDDTYNPVNDSYGFYDAPSSFDYVFTEPLSPNVVVPLNGILDLDVWVGKPIT
jgi:hypothetical protein